MKPRADFTRSKTGVSVKPRADVTRHPCFGLLVTSALGFKDRVDPFFLLTVWQLSLFDSHTCRRVRKHWWRFGARTHDCPSARSRHSAVYHSAKGEITKKNDVALLKPMHVDT